MKIPQEYQQLCKDLAKVLRDFNHEHGYRKKESADEEKIIFRFTGKISAMEPNMSNINFYWENGRHGDTQGKITIETEIRVQTEIDDI